VTCIAVYQAAIRSPDAKGGDMVEEHAAAVTIDDQKVESRPIAPPQISLPAQSRTRPAGPIEET
jgi:hypothetical protein